MEKKWCSQAMQDNSAKTSWNSVSLCCHGLKPTFSNTHTKTTTALDTFQQVWLACTEKAIFFFMHLDNWNVYRSNVRINQKSLQKTKKDTLPSPKIIIIKKKSSNSVYNETSLKNHLPATPETDTSYCLYQKKKPPIKQQKPAPLSCSSTYYSRNTSPTAKRDTKPAPTVKNQNLAA